MWNLSGTISGTSPVLHQRVCVHVLQKKSDKWTETSAREME